MRLLLAAVYIGACFGILIFMEQAEDMGCISEPEVKKPYVQSKGEEEEAEPFVSD